MSVEINTAAAEFIEESSKVTWFGHTFNVYAAMVIALFILFVVGIYKAHRSGRIDLLDLITAVNQTTGKHEASTTRILQLLGGLTGTFIVIKLTLTAVMTWDIFAIYLAYVASVDGFTRLLLAKYGVNTTTAPANGSQKPKDND